MAPVLLLPSVPAAPSIPPPPPAPIPPPAIAVRRAWFYIQPFAKMRMRTRGPDARRHFQVGTRYDIEFTDASGREQTASNRQCLKVLPSEVTFFWGRSDYIIPFADITSHEQTPDRALTLNQLRAGRRHTFRINGEDHDVYKTAKRGETYASIAEVNVGVWADRCAGRLVTG